MVAFVHPRFTRMAGRSLWNARCDIQAKTVTPDQYGQEVETWGTVKRHLLAAVAPVNAIEQQAAGYTTTDQAWHILLAGCHADITTRHRATVDGVIYDIDAVEPDRYGDFTRLRVRRVTI